MTVRSGLPMNDDPWEITDEDTDAALARVDDPDMGEGMALRCALEIRDRLRARVSAPPVGEPNREDLHLVARQAFDDNVGFKTDTDEEEAGYDRVIDALWVAVEEVLDAVAAPPGTGMAEELAEALRDLIRVVDGPDHGDETLTAVDVADRMIAARETVRIYDATKAKP